MSLQLAAQHLQSHGRGEDNQLVHMTTGELDALQKLAQAHGGSLTLNPHTGLPEAGFLSSILPTVAGIGLGIATGDPFLAAAIVGGADYAMTGSLGQGLMAGLGAWSGANLAGDIGKAATTAATTDASQTGNAVMAATNATIPTTAGMAGTGNMIDTTMGGIVGSGQALGAEAAQAGLTPGEYLAANPGIANAGATAAGQAAAVPGTTFFGNNPLNPTGWDTFKSGFGNVTQDWSHFKDFVGANKMDVLGTALPFVGAAAKAMQPGLPNAQPQQYNNPAGFQRISKDFKGQFPTPPANPYQAQYPNYVTNPYNPSNFTVAANGGLMAVDHMKSGGMSGSDIYDAFNAQNVKNAQQGKAMYDAIVENAKESNTQPFDPGYEKAYEGMNPYQRAHAMVANMHKNAFMPGKPQTQEMNGLGSIATDPSMVAQAQIAQQVQHPTDAKEGGLMAYSHGGGVNYSMGGIGSLGSFSDGGQLLRGPGDGVSDSIPASIGNKQPARLAEGEFVVPARIVSELGNGSTDAGAKRLYAMMDRIKAKRAKTKNIAADTKAYKYLPA